MEFNEFVKVYEALKLHKDEIFINVDKKKIIEAYKDNPEELINILKHVKDYKPMKEIKQICSIEAKPNIITFILNNIKLIDD